MTSKDLKKLNINVAGRMYPVMVDEEEAQAVKKIEREVNDKVSDYQMTYSNQDKLDCISMVMLTYAFDNQKMIRTESIGSRLSQLDTLLDAALS